MRVATALSLCACMMLGSIVLSADRTSAQTDDAIFRGNVILSGFPAPETLVMYSVDSQDTPAGNSTVTDSSGNYELWVEGGHTYFLYFANGLAMFDASAVQERSIFPGETIVVDVVLNSAPTTTATVRGNVYNASNPSEPVTTGHVLGLRFSAMGGDDNPDYINWTVTDGTGYYEIDVLNGSVVVAVFDAPGYYPGMTSPAMILPGGSATIDVPLYPLSYADVNISGVVSDYDLGGPIEGALVEAYLEDMPVSFRDTTDVDGEYLIPLMHGEGDMRVSADGYVTQTEYDMLFSGEMTVDWALRQSNAVIYGLVLDAVTLEPVQDAEVETGSHLAGNRGMTNDTTTNESGYFEMGVCDGSWWVGAWAQDYGENWTTANLSPDEWVYVEILLPPKNSLVKGIVKDGSSGDPIAGATVLLMDEGEDREMSGTNVSGYYEINCTAGAYQMIFTATGYMLEMQDGLRTEVGVNEVIWMNYTMDAATTMLYGDVLDAATLAPLDGADIGTGSVSPYNPEFMRIAFATSTGGTYSTMVAPTESQFLSSELSGYQQYIAIFEVPDVPGVEHDIYMMPEGGVGTTYTITGYVNESVSDMPIPSAQVGAYSGLWSQLNGTSTDGTGFYSFEVPTVVLKLMASGVGYLPEERLIMPQPPDSVLWQNFSLDSHTVPPMIDLTIDPTENVSTANHADIYGVVTEEYLYAVNLDMLRTIEVSGGKARMERLESLGFMPGMPWTNLAGGETSPGVWEIGLWDWPATAHYGVHMIKDSTAQGFFVDSDQDYYWIDDGDDTIHIEGWYQNGSIAESPAAAVFYNDGMLAGIDLGWGPDWWAAMDPSGRFWLESFVLTVNLTTRLVEDGATEVLNKVVTSTMYLDLESAPIYPSGDYAVRFWVIDEASLWNYTIGFFTIDNDPPAADAGADQTAIVNTVVTLDASLSWDGVGIVEYMWTIDDGGTVVRYGMIVDYEFTTVGDHEVILTVTDGAMLTGTDSLWVEVTEDQVPIADAGGDQSVDEDVEVTLNGTVSWDDLGIVDWTWTFDDDGEQTLSGEVVTYTFNTPGIYTVTLVVTDTIGQVSDPDTAVITVADITSPVANAGANSTVTAGFEVTLSGVGSSDNVAVVSWTWTFDDDGAKTLTGETAKYTFSNVGEFLVTLTVEDAAGLTDDDTVTITVIDDADPVADAGPDQDVFVGDEVTFDGSGSSDNVGVVNWTWTFDEDGTDVTLYGESPSREFLIEGPFTVTLTVSDEAGNSDTDEVVIRVVSENQPPTADAGDEATIEEGETHDFDGTGSSDDGGLSDLNFTWTFVYDDEEVKLYGAEPSFEFEIAGEYTVNLTVTDEQGLSDWDTVTITVEEKAGTSLMLWAAIGAIVVVVVLLAAFVLMRRGKGVPPAGGEEPEEFEEPGPPEDEEL